MIEVQQRFKLKIIINSAGCWVWIAGKIDAGYGMFWLNGKQVRAHRASWAIFVGAIPDGINVLHKCDNKACVNPKHLFLGTQKENIADCIKKGRWNPFKPFGNKNSAKKRSPEICAAISARQKGKPWSKARRAAQLIKHKGECHEPSIE